MKNLIAAMKFVLIIVVSVCLTQDTASGHAIVERAANPMEAAIEGALAAVGTLATQVGNAVLAGNRLLIEYSDNSTDYAATFEINIHDEINATRMAIDRAIANATAIASSSNGNVLACLTAIQGRAQEFAVNLTKEVSKCVGTKVREYVTLRVNLETMGNSALNIVPTANASIQTCKQQSNELAKYGCMGVQVANAAAKLGEISVSVGSTVAAASTAFATFQTNLTLCAQAKLFMFRRVIIELPVTIGSCAVQTLSG